MEKSINKRSNGTNNAMNVLIGVLIGGLAGAAAMLLYAPQSGKRTRNLIQEKSIELRDQTNRNIKKAVAQVRSKTNSLKADVLEKAGELKQLGQDKIVENLDRASAAVEAA